MPGNVSVPCVRKKSHRHIWRELMKQIRTLKALHTVTRGLPEACHYLEFAFFSRKKLIHKITWLDSQKNFPTQSSFQGWRTSFKTDVCSGPIYPSEATRWTKKSRDGYCCGRSQTSQSIFLETNSQTPRCLMQRPLPF